MTADASCKLPLTVSSFRGEWRSKRGDGSFSYHPGEIKKCWIPNIDILAGEKSQRKKLIPQSVWMLETSLSDKLSWAVSALNQYTSTLLPDSCSLESPPGRWEVASIPLPPHAAPREGPFSLISIEDSSEIENTLNCSNKQKVTKVFIISGKEFVRNTWNIW